MEEYLVTYYVYFNFGDVYKLFNGLIGIRDRCMLRIYISLARPIVEIKIIVVEKVNLY